MSRGGLIQFAGLGVYDVFYILYRFHFALNSTRQPGLLDLLKNPLEKRGRGKPEFMDKIMTRYKWRTQGFGNIIRIKSGEGVVYKLSKRQVSFIVSLSPHIPKTMQEYIRGIVTALDKEPS